jgi:phosphate starvation-inducible protein PhoH
MSKVEEMKTSKKKRFQMIDEKEESSKVVKAHPKNDGQKNLLQAIDENIVTLVSGVPGTGKAQPLTSKVITPAGYKFMAEIAIGDDVCTPDGSTAKVTGIFPQGVKPIYRLHFRDGDCVEACAEHLWKVRRLNGHRDKPKIVNTRWLIDHLTDTSGKVSWGIDCPSPVQFNALPVVIDPYVMGVLLGDGGITHFTGVSSEDSEILAGVADTLQQDYHLKHYKGSDYRIVKRVRGGPSIYCDALRHYGIFGKKSYEKHIPKEFLYNSIDVRLAVLQGLMDTDGTVDKRGACSFSSSSFALVLDFKELVQSLGGVARISSKHPTYVYRGDVKTGRLAYTASVQFPDHCNLFRLSKKLDRVKPLMRLGTTRSIVKIERIDDVAAQCIMIDSPDHLYLTDHFVPTHNTFIAVSYGLQMLFRGRYKRLIITRPYVEAGERLGYLPGSFEEKTAPFLQPIFDALGKYLSKTDINEMLDEGQLVILPLAYMRGVTFQEAVVVCDEGQNATAKQLHMLLTRIGEKSKVIVAGDPCQSDIGRDSGFQDAIERLEGVKGLKSVYLDASCVVRDPIVAEIDKRYSTGE